MHSVEGEKWVGVRDGRVFQRRTSSGATDETNSGVRHDWGIPRRPSMGRAVLLSNLNER